MDNIQDVIKARELISKELRLQAEALKATTLIVASRAKAGFKKDSEEVNNVLRTIDIVTELLNELQ
jgi:hypothetical protein